MHSESDFIRAICSHPHDDAPRLLYCDWLEDRNYPGDAARAETIRLQIARGKTAHREQFRYMKSDRLFPYSGLIRRGFVYLVNLFAASLEQDDAHELIRHIFVNHPIEYVMVIDATAAFDLIPVWGESWFSFAPRQHRWGRMPTDIYKHWPDPAGPFGGTTYRSPKEALNALSDSIVSWGRSLAGLPALQTLPAEPAQSSGR